MTLLPSTQPSLPFGGPPSSSPGGAGGPPLHTRALAAVTAFLAAPLHYATHTLRLRRAGTVGSDGEDVLDAEEEELVERGLVGVGLAGAGAGADGEQDRRRRLSRELEEGFRDSSDEEEEDGRGRET